MKNKTFYITTPIYYPSGNLHIGNTYTTVVCDAIARYKKEMGYDVYYLTGTDEHGQKIQNKAMENNLTCQEYVDKMADGIQDLWKKLKICNNDFIRTTQLRHEKVVQKVFTKFLNNGDIYLGKYQGWYCKECESFFTKTQLVDGKCPDCGRDVEKRSEEAYFFKMSKYQERLIEYIETHPEFIEPESRKNEMLNNFLKPGLQDLCVSRTSFDWGVKVPFNDKHVVYVWIDALSNYITNIGYDVDGESEEFHKWWPADLHLIGKDIIRFHTIYWPILLMALDLPLPKQVFGHPWLLMNNDKMSKSKGNIMYADDLVHLFGVDAIRYYVLHEIPFANDGTINYELIIERINGDLANILGNLVNRTISMAKKYFDGKVENKNVREDLDEEFISSIQNLPGKVDECMDHLEIGKSIDAIFDVLRKSNKYIDDTMPWSLAKDEDKKMRLLTVLYHLLESIKVCAYELAPFMPDTSKEILRQIHVEDADNTFCEDTVYEVENPEPIFMRIDMEKKLAEIENIK